MKSEGYRLAIHSGARGLACLRPQWLALTAELERPSPAHFPQWYEAFLQRPDVQGRPLDFLTVHRGPRLAAVFPVGIDTSQRLQLKHLSIPPGPELDVVPDVVIGAREHASTVFDFLVSSLRRHPSYPWDSLRARGVLEGSHLSACMAGAAGRSAIRESAGNCCVIPLRARARERAPLSRNFRASLRTARNRLRTAGPVAFACHTDPESVATAFDVYVQLESSGWKARHDHGKDDYWGGKALLLHPPKLTFWRHLTRLFAQGGHAAIYQLDVDGIPIAAQIALVLNDVCYLLKTAYAEHYARVSPGHMLLEHVIEHHTAQGAVSLINLVSDYRWIERWQPERWRYMNYECFNSTLRGCVHKARRRATSTWRSKRGY